MKTIVFSLLFLLFCTSQLGAQRLHWAKKDSTSIAVALDNNENVISIGLHSLHKYNVYGRKLWDFSLLNGDTTAKTLVLHSVAVDAAGNVYVGGYFGGVDIDFNPSAVTALMSSHDTGAVQNRSIDMFLAKYDANGNYQWAFNIGGTNSPDVIEDICTDAAGNVYATGVFSGDNVDFDPSAAMHAMSAVGQVEPFLAKYNTNGQYLNAVRFGGPMVNQLDWYNCQNSACAFDNHLLWEQTTASHAIATDRQGNIIIAGEYMGTIDLDPGVDSVKHTSFAQWAQQAFMVKVDSIFNYKWGLTIGDNSWGYLGIRDIGVDEAGNIYYTGGFSGYNVDFDPGPATHYLASQQTTHDLLIGKYDKNGNYGFAYTMGSAQQERANCIAVRPNGEFTIAGEFSTFFDIDPNPMTQSLITAVAAYDGFVARFDASGNLESTFSLGGGGFDQINGIGMRNDGWYNPAVSPGSYPFNDEVYICGLSRLQVDFDPAPQQQLVLNDALFQAKYTETKWINRMHAAAFMDYNVNGVKDPGELLLKNARFSWWKANSDTVNTFASGGSFVAPMDTGTYYSSVKAYTPANYQVTPAIHTRNFTNYLGSDTAWFAVQIPPSLQDLYVAFNATTWANIWLPHIINVTYQNRGGSAANGCVDFIKASVMMIDSASAPYITIGDTLRFNFSNLLPGEVQHIDVYLKFSSLAVPHDYVFPAVRISPIAGDVNPGDNYASVKEFLVTSNDPNGKFEAHGGVITPAEAATDYMQYTICFQNNGTDTAYNIRVRDILSDKLDWSTLEMVSASHPYELTVLTGDHCEWAFSDIKLVDSNTNERLSHGYITYRIKAKAGLQPGDMIKNSAAIFFDYNEPVITNTDTTVVKAWGLPLNLLTFTATRDGKTNKLQWSTADEVNVEKFDIERSANGREYSSIGVVRAGLNNYFFNDNAPLPRNYYRLKMIDRDGRFDYSPVRVVNNDGSFYVSVYPNPAKDKLQVMMESDKKATLQVQVVAQDGKVLLSTTWNVSEGSVVKIINTSALQSGSYFMRVSSQTMAGGRGAEQTVVKFEKQ